MQLIPRIFHKSNKLVGVVKCTDHVVVSGGAMVKRTSHTASFKLKAIELAEATSNRNAGKELGIKEKLVQDWRKKTTELVKQTEQAEQ